MTDTSPCGVPPITDDIGRVSGEELRELIPEEIVEAVPRGVDLVVNPGGAASVRIPFPAFESVARPAR